MNNVRVKHPCAGGSKVESEPVNKEISKGLISHMMLGEHLRTHSVTKCNDRHL